MPECEYKRQITVEPPSPTINFDLLLSEKDDLIRHMQIVMQSQQQTIEEFEAEKQECEAKLAKAELDLKTAQNELSDMRKFVGNFFLTRYIES